MRNRLQKILLPLFLLLLCNCAGTKFYFFGVDMDWLKKAKGKDVAVMGLGIVSSVAVHALGHVLYLEFKGKDWEFRNNYTHEYVKDDLSDGEKRWFGRIGFVAQNGVGLLLTSFERTRQSYFTRGYVATAAVETWTYPIRHGFSNGNEHYSDGDLDMIHDGGGNAELEWAFYSGVALHNMLRLKW